MRQTERIGRFGKQRMNGSEKRNATSRRFYGHGGETSGDSDFPEGYCYHNCGTTHSIDGCDASLADETVPSLSLRPLAPESVQAVHPPPRFSPHLQFTSTPNADPISALLAATLFFRSDPNQRASLLLHSSNIQAMRRSCPRDAPANRTLRRSPFPLSS